MRDLVVKTLEFERLDSSKTVFDISDINLLETVNSVIENKQLIFKEKKINIENNINKKIMARADNLQLGELFDNLITNAVKFTPQDGTITIDAKRVRDFVTVSIKDTGIGMTKEQINSIFAEFYKVGPAQHDLDSSGLGLSICKRIVEKHGGQIWAESPGLGKGTTFYFTIPFRLKK
jgi:signal transduction histidine kinase